MPQQRVVFQLAEGGADSHESALRNVRNTMADLGEAEICLVAHGPGVRLITGETGFADQLDELIKNGVEVVACRNTMARLGIGDDALRPGVRTVSAGIGELVRRQNGGWAYVRV